MERGSVSMRKRPEQRDVVRGRRGTASGLVRSCHLGPTVAVTLLAALLALGAGVPAVRTLLVVAAVLAGQLSIGWSNDLLDAARDRQVARAEKPVVRGDVDERTLAVAAGAALVVAVVLPVVTGLLERPAAAVAGLLVVAGGWAYNLGLKATAASWVPYAVAFGALPGFVLLADGRGVPTWLVLAGALLGVGAHVLNVVADLADDAATGVRGMPHRLGLRWAPPAGAGLLLAATAVMVLGAPVTGLPAALLLPLVVLLAVVAALAPGRQGFRAAIGVAVVDVVLLVGVSGGLR